MFISITAMLSLLLQTLAMEIRMLNAESTTGMPQTTSLSPGHAENAVSIKPAENLDQLTSTPTPVTVPASTTISKTVSPLKDVTDVSSCDPWFVCVHGTCSKGMRCSCYEGWAGLLCDELCPEKCAPHGTCVTSSSNQAVCVCNDTSVFISAVGCVERPPAPPTTTSPTISAEYSPTTTAAASTTTEDPASLADKDCFGIFTCVHGSCQAMSLACDCDRGWKGQLCDQPCELNCGEHGKCQEKDFILYCECDYPYTGDDCTNVTTTTIGASTTSPAPVPTMANEDFDVSQWFNMARSPASDSGDTATSYEDSGSGTSGAAGSSTAGTSKLRPISQRQCIPGFVCQHGYCPKGAILCACDKAWGGTFCNLACDLPCGKNGTCIVRDGEAPYCHCGSEHNKGSNCQQPGEGSPTGPSKPDATVTTHAKSSANHSVLPPGNDPWRHLVEKNGQLPPLTQRFCLSGVTCAYGNCSSYNGSSTTCLCEPNFTGLFCQYPCPLDCGQQGQCTYDYVNDTAQCECYFPYTGVNCTEIISEQSEESPTVWVVCLAVVLFLLSVVLLIALSVWLYKRRNITMMKVVHWFQPFEEDDSKEYDAFVSYSSSDLDRQFVLQTLVPRLEGRMCFTLCIHQRNFVAGQFISDNIVESVKRSRRTLLVVSPSFVSSGWCRFEYQMALQEMLTDRHKVLPIIIGDVSSVRSQIDDTLQRILKSVTWLEYPTKCSGEQEYEHFWKRLQLSMPKKRAVHLEITNTQSCLASLSSALSTDESKDKDTLPTSYLLSNECSNTGLLQSIVRIPANHVVFNDSSLQSANIGLDKILETRQDEDSKNGTLGSTVADISLGSTSSEPSLAPSLSAESCVNSTVGDPEMEAADNIPGSPVPSNQHGSNDTTSQSSHLNRDLDSNNESSDEEDLPACMIENYLGTLEIRNVVTV